MVYDIYSGANSLVLQTLYFAVALSLNNSIVEVTYSLSDVPVVTWALVVLWPFLLVALHELVKHREIKYL